ncbi:hypothetical protein RDV89_20025 [Nocardioides zeae]|uniref:Uncharacterized protein n=1 Tax=Nocardioides imazamoxiresistens TaxID=3231893 RepID=A0ABU3Q1J4_9ACTN|nr:hypothetical protein [Nocardioides zeae]MDT9595382.1 hypothetical protein [Nocardioides zeae]
MRRLLLLPVLALAAPLLTAAPASAATVDSFTLEGFADDLAAYAGTTIEVAWDVVPLDATATVAVAPAGTAVDVLAGWDAATVAGAVDSVVDVTIPEDAEPGAEYTFQLLVSEDGAAAVSDVLTVLVLETPVSVTPPPVVFDGCDVVIPDVEGVGWTVEERYFDEGYSSTLEIEPGRYPLAAFGDGNDTTFFAFPRYGFELDPGAPDSFPVAEEDQACFDADVVEIKPGCGTVIVSNPSEVTVDLYVEPSDNDNVGTGIEAQIFSLEPGMAVTVEVDAGSVYVDAGVTIPTGWGEAEYVSVQSVTDLELDPACAGTAPVARPTHPTAAPAAGA